MALLHIHEVPDLLRVGTEIGNTILSQEIKPQPKHTVKQRMDEVPCH